MITKTVFAGIFAAVASIGQAAVVDVTITGKIGGARSGSVGVFYDLGNLVWAGNAVVGADFTAVYTYDTSKGIAGSQDGPFGSKVYSLEGGLRDGIAPSPISGTFTIGNISRSVSGEDVGNLYLNAGGSFAGVGGDTASYLATDFLSFDPNTNKVGIAEMRFFFDAPFGTVPSDIAAGYDISFDRAGSISGANAYGASGYFAFSEPELGSDSTISFVADRVVARPREEVGPTVVPLPASAGLLLGCLGSLAALQYGRRDRRGRADL